MRNLPGHRILIMGNDDVAEVDDAPRDARAGPGPAGAGADGAGGTMKARAAESHLICRAAEIEDRHRGREHQRPGRPARGGSPNAGLRSRAPPMGARDRNRDESGGARGGPAV